MSSLNPIVGVSLCIGALGAGLAYLAYNNNDDENEEEIKHETQEVKPDPQEIKPEPQEVKHKPSEDGKKRTNMQQFLQDAYEKTN